MGCSRRFMRAIFLKTQRLIAFVIIGIAIAAIGETQFSVFIRSDVGNLLASIVFNALYLSLCCLVSNLLVKRFGDCVATIVLHVVIFGSTGLIIEWFLINNSPWAAPQASQVGMFSFWSSMVVVPFVCLRPQACFTHLKKTILLAVLVYTMVAIAIQLIPSPTLHFIYHIWAVILGYTALVSFSAVGYVRNLGRLIQSVCSTDSRPELSNSHYD